MRRQIRNVQVRWVLFLLSGWSTVRIMVTHFGHLRLDVFRGQGFDRSLGCGGTIKIDETITFAFVGGFVEDRFRGDYCTKSLAHGHKIFIGGARIEPPNIQIGLGQLLGTVRAAVR